MGTMREGAGPLCSAHQSSSHYGRVDFKNSPDVRTIESIGSGGCGGKQGTAQTRDRLSFLSCSLNITPQSCFLLSTVAGQGKLFKLLVLSKPNLQDVSIDVSAKCKGPGNTGSETLRARGPSFPAQPAGWEVGLKNLSRSATKEDDSEVELDSFISPRVRTRDPKSSPGSSTGCG